jgi:nicotinate-nucleotide pyrophosphorylase (carboxylating)
VEIPSQVSAFIQRALEEDIGHGDVTTTCLIQEKARSRAAYISKSDFILAGIHFCSEVYKLIDPSLNFKILAKEGNRVQKNDIIASVAGSTRSILLGERVSLNILQRLSGIATLTRTYVKKIRGTKAKIFDTRKTTPCMRFMEKYAVRTGGGSNHRFGLFDGILIKDNHIKSVGSLKKAIDSLRGRNHLLKIEVEVNSIKTFLEALKAGADIIMLDNMPVKKIEKAVKMSKGRVLLEASGGITLDNVSNIAKTGVDFISVGALTHSAAAADISLKFQ